MIEEALPPPTLTPPLLVSHAECARLCGVSRTQWFKMLAGDRVGPAPIKLGGRVLFRPAELSAWIEAGCPNRVTWQARLALSKAR